MVKAIPIIASRKRKVLQGAEITYLPVDLLCPIVGVHNRIGDSLGMEEGPYQQAERSHGRPKPNF
jgi:hypothetical protein